MKIQKFSTLKEKEQNTVIEHVEAMEASMKLEDNKRGPFSKEQFGMCHDCSFLLANITEYGNTNACCLKFKKYSSGKDSVKYCTIAELVNMLTQLNLDDTINLRDISVNFLANKLINHYEKV